MNEGFFTRKETESKSRPDGKTYSCASCGLYHDATSPRMKPFGNFKKGILNLGEAPGEIEDKRGKQWQGKTGRLLQKTYYRHPLSYRYRCQIPGLARTESPGHRRQRMPRLQNPCFSSFRPEWYMTHQVYI